MKFFLAAVLMVAPTITMAGKHSDDLQDQVKTATKAADQLRDNPNLTPEQTREQQKIKDGAVGKIEAIANSDPKDAETQLEAGKGLASVDEGPRAVPYAERGLSLAQASGDPKLIRQALLTGSEVYYKAGNYDLAAKRAQAVLRTNPKDPDAMALYMQVKGRTSTPSSLHKSNEPNKDTPAAASSNNAPSQTTQPRPAVNMTSASSLEVQRHLSTGRSRLALDPAAALKSFDAAVAADPNSAEAKLERAKARLQTGDASGAVADANAALAIQGNLAEAFALRADANRALGAAEAAIIADYEQASKLDNRFTAAYQELVAKAAGGSNPQPEPGRTVNVAGSSAPRSFHMAQLDSPKSWLKLALIAAVLCAIAGILVPAFLKRRSGEDDSQNR